MIRLRPFSPIAFAPFAALLIAAGCKPKPGGDEVVVEWPELGALDIPSAKAEGLAKKKQVSALREMLPEVANLAAAVNEDSLPDNAKNPERVRVLIADLANLVKEVKGIASLDDADLLIVGEAFHPLVAELMKESGMPHIHEGEGPNGGYLHPLAMGGTTVGQLEIKLHDDAGDLEVWLTEGQSGERPLDLSLDTVIKVEFPEMSGRQLVLQVRNKEGNEDEDGASTVRDGKTNYFIFPGETGADADWLMGKDFATPVELSFSAGGDEYRSGPFELKPHVH